MPDLTIESAWTCATNERWETTVEGSKGETYRVAWERLYGAQAARVGAQFGWTCSCKGFGFRGTCRHVDAVEAEGKRCGWNAHLEPTEEPDENGCCPGCGGNLVAYRVAV